MIVIAAADAPQFTIPGTTFTSLAAPSRGATETSVWRVRVAPGNSGVVHQLTREEIFVVLAGAASVQVGAQRRDLGAGDTLIVPAGIDFALSNPGDAAFEAIALLPVGGEARIGDAPPFVPPWAA